MKNWAIFHYAIVSSSLPQVLNFKDLVIPFSTCQPVSAIFRNQGKNMRVSMCPSIVFKGPWLGEKWGLECLDGSAFQEISDNKSLSNFLKFEHTSEIYRHDMPNFMTEICESRLLFGCFQDALFRNLNQAPPRRGEHMSTYLLAGERYWQALRIFLQREWGVAEVRIQFPIAFFGQVRHFSANSAMNYKPLLNPEYL